MSFVLIDIGGTFIKAAHIVSDTSSVSQVINGPVRLRLPSFLPATGDARCIDPAALMSVVREAIELVSEPTGPAPEAILISGQMAGLAFVDEKGQAEAPVISWQDERFRDVSGVAAALSAEVLCMLGEGLRVGLPLVTLKEYEIPADSFVTSLLGFVAGSLVGHRAESLHVTDAASWGLVNIHTGDWEPTVLEMLGLKVNRLPAVSPSVTPLGPCEALGGAPVLTAVGDQQAALLGIGLSVDEVSINLATGCQVSVITDNPQLDRDIQIRPYFDGEFLRTRTHLPAGRLLENAVTRAYGHDVPQSWARAESEYERGGLNSLVKEAVDTIVDSLEGALDVVARGSDMPIAWSGGLAQRFPAVRDELARRTGRSSRVYSGNDAALAGLAVLTTTFADK